MEANHTVTAQQTAENVDCRVSGYKTAMFENPLIAQTHRYVVCQIPARPDRLVFPYVGHSRPQRCRQNDYAATAHQAYHNIEDTLFVNADDLYFTEHRLFDLASDFYKNGGKHLFIDEVHKYQDWSKGMSLRKSKPFQIHQILFFSSCRFCCFKDQNQRMFTGNRFDMGFMNSISHLTIHCFQVTDS